MHSGIAATPTAGSEGIIFHGPQDIKFGPGLIIRLDSNI